MMNKATYPGMSLGGEVRESISLDEDDLSDVEDEVFIRDGKNSYKLAEELNVKRPLMAPRRKLGKPDLTSRLKAKPPCKAFCKPCCYIFAALSILIGLITLVVILVSIFPLPLDKLRDWVISKSQPVKNSIKLLPCSNLKISDVWVTNFPVLTTDSPVRILDLNGDGVDDIIFGFGTGDNYGVLPPDIFCPIFLGVDPPCEGGVIALNGTTGDMVWRYWINDTIFDVQCSADLTGDGLNDCLAIGVQGTLAAIDAKNGTLIWIQHNNITDIFVGNFIPDQNNDSVADVICSHSSLTSGGEGHLVLISGKSGQELKRIRTPSGAKTFFMPQMLKMKNSQYLIFGTGSPKSPGNLSVSSTETVVHGNFSARTIYEDHHKGVLTQSVLVDITGDNIPDIVTAMYNSTVVAINGLTFGQIWNYTIPNSESNVTPTPAYFNDDNVTDFLIIYEKYDNILNYNYTQTYVIDGKTGKSIYSKPIGGSVSTQMSALTLGMESHGFDMFLFWTSECTNVDMYLKNKLPDKDDNFDSGSDVCRKQFNSTTIMKLNALNKYDQPPGFEIYNSVNRTSFEYSNVKSPIKQIREYFVKHPKIQMTTQGQSEVDESYVDDSQNIRVHKYGTSSFRHKDNRQGIVKDYMSNDNNNNNNPEINDGIETKYDNDYDWRQTNMMNIPEGEDADFSNNYNNFDIDESDNANMFNQNQMLYNQPSSKNNRDPRSKVDVTKQQTEAKNQKKTSQSRKKNLSDPKYEILRDTYFKNRESQLRKSKFEQRDITSHIDKMKQNEELKNIVNQERKAAENASLNLWDLESERELQDKENGYWRGKREVNYTFNGIRKISSVGALAKTFNTTSNSIDVIFITYWVPNRIEDTEALHNDEIKDCVEEKLSNGSENQAHSYQKTTEQEQRDLFKSECIREQNELKNGFSYFNQIYQLRLGRMTVYRVKIECLCDVQKVYERCAKFLPQNEQSWSMYLGKHGDGLFDTRN